MTSLEGEKRLIYMDFCERQMQVTGVWRTAANKGEWQRPRDRRAMESVGSPVY